MSLRWSSALIPAVTISAVTVTLVPPVTGASVIVPAFLGSSFSRSEVRARNGVESSRAAFGDGSREADIADLPRREKRQLAIAGFDFNQPCILRCYRPDVPVQALRGSSHRS